MNLPNKIELIHSIVLIGNFNPTVFQPVWLKDTGLLSEPDSEATQIKVIHPEVAELEADWFHLIVTRDRFSIRTKLESHHESLRDLVLGTFKILESTPLRQLGINFLGDFGPYESERWHGIGDLLAPKEKWREILNSPGLFNLQIKSLKENDEDGFIITTLQPSKTNPNSIHIDLNDHYQLKDLEKPISATEIISMLNEKWGTSVENSLKIINNILSWI